MLFTNATITTMNPTRDIVTNGAIAINDNCIIAVGKFASHLMLIENLGYLMLILV